MRRDTLAWLGARALTRRLGLPRAKSFRVERSLPVPMRDGAVLLADHYAPRTRKPAGTLLMRGPYGRDGLPNRVFAGLYAGQGFHVILQSTRGTFGSEGAFEPGRHEVDDGADTVEWLREQPWYTGEFATVGASYLGFTQLALLVDQPADLTTSVITMAPHDFGHSVWSTGSFALGDFLGWSYQVAWQHRGGWNPSDGSRHGDAANPEAGPGDAAARSGGGRIAGRTHPMVQRVARTAGIRRRRTGRRTAWRRRSTTCAAQCC
ncbi:hypothetical protein MAUB1S_03335 [Mycolicibacterium aubagnense]